jgi:hypothetical protein
VARYNTERPHQSGGGRPPVERFALVERSLLVVDEPVTVPAPRPRSCPGQQMSRWVDGASRISLAGFEGVRLDADALTVEPLILGDTEQAGARRAGACSSAASTWMEHTAGDYQTAFCQVSGIVRPELTSEL